MLESLIGAAVGIVTILTARFIGGQRWLYALGLVTLPSLYALFALHVGERDVGIREMIYGIPFLVGGVVLAFVSIRYSAVIVGALWILHGAYDLIHGRLITNAGVPEWYPVWCCSVDMVVGAYLLWFSRRVPEANLRCA